MAVIDDILASPMVAVDTETDENYPACKTALKGLSLAWGDPASPIGRYWSFEKDPSSWASVREKYIEPLFASKDARLVFWNAKFDLQVLGARDLKPKGTIIDAMMLHYLLDEGDDHGLKDRARADLGAKDATSHAAVKKEMKGILKEGQQTIRSWVQSVWILYKRERLKSREAEEWVDGAWPLVKRVAMSLPPGMKKADVLARADAKIRPVMEADAEAKRGKRFSEYGKSDAIWTLQLGVRYLAEVERQGFHDLFFNLEMPFVKELARIETRGVRLDRKQLAKLRKMYSTAVTSLQEAFRSRYGDEFNPGSPDQMRELFWIKKGIKAPDWAMTTKKAQGGDRRFASVNADVLVWIAGEYNDKDAIDLVRLRRLDKILGTYIIPLYEIAKSDGEGRVHTSFNPVGTPNDRVCVGPETLVATDKGTFRISKLPLTNAQKLHTMSHRGRWCAILRSIYKGKELLYKVVLTNGASIRCTRAHRFLTPEGWRHLYELKEGSVVLTSFGRRTGRGEHSEKGSFGGGLRPLVCNGAPSCKGGSKAVSGAILPRDYCLKEGVCEEVWRGVATCSQLASRPCDEGEYTRRQGKPRDSLVALRFGKEVAGREVVENYFQGTRNERVVCSAKYPTLRVAKRWGSSVADATRGFGVPTPTGELLSRHHKSSQGILRKTDGVFSSTLPCSSSVRADEVVYSGSSEGAKVLPGQRDDCEGPYGVGNQVQGGNHTCVGSFGRQDPTSKGVLLLQKVEGGLLLSRSSTFGGSGWEHTPIHHERSTSQEKRYRSEVGLPHDSLPWGRSGKEYAGRCGQDQGATSMIASITPTYMDEVWDIEVEGDHSYNAQGFVNHNSSSEPNLQNQPKPGTAEDALPKAPSTRTVFIPKDGYSFVVADFSQIELRMMAHYSQDKNLLSAYRTWKCFTCGAEGDTNKAFMVCPECWEDRLEWRKAKEKGRGFALGRDIHWETGVETGLVGHYGEKEGRDRAKATNFGLIYGMGAKLLASQIGVPLEVAEEVHERYFDRYNGVLNFHHWVESTIINRGWFKLLTGRIRHFLREKRSHVQGVYDGQDAWLFYRVVREATNAIIQGGAAGLMKKVMVRLAEIFDGSNKFGDTGIILQVHDELVVETPDDKVEAVAKVVQETMENTHALRVPVLADLRWGKGWEK